MGEKAMVEKSSHIGKARRGMCRIFIITQRLFSKKMKSEKQRGDSTGQQSSPVSNQVGYVMSGL